MSDNGDIEPTTTFWHLTPLRVACFVIGGITITFSLMADQFGFGQPGSFGIGQLLLALFGFFVLLLGLLGKRIVKLYRGAAILLLNTFVSPIVISIALAMLHMFGCSHCVSPKSWMIDTYFTAAYFLRSSRVDLRIKSTL